MRNIQNKSGAEFFRNAFRYGVRPSRSPRTLLFGPRHWNADPDHRHEAKIRPSHVRGIPAASRRRYFLVEAIGPSGSPGNGALDASRLFGFRRLVCLMFGSRQPAPDAKRVDEQKHGVLDEKRTFALQPSVYHPGDRRNDKDRKSRYCNAGVPGGREDRCSGRERSERCQFHFRCAQLKGCLTGTGSPFFPSRLTRLCGSRCAEPSRSACCPLLFLHRGSVAGRRRSHYGPACLPRRSACHSE